MMKFFVTSPLRNRFYSFVRSGWLQPVTNLATFHGKEQAPIALANSTALDNSEFEIAIGNDVALGDDGWALIAPFGEHPKSRLVPKNGGVALENYIQVVDEEAVDGVLAAQNRLLPRLKRALVGIPVYRLHPDLPEYSPESVSGRPPIKETLGIIDKFRKTDRGLEAHFTLTQDGAKAVANDGYKFPSIFWWVTPIGTQGDAIRVRPTSFISAGLTPTPNIKGVDSLANSLSASARAAGGDQKKDPMKNILIGFLAAQGISLANDSGDQAVLAAVNQIITSKTGEVTSLRTENSTLTGKITALENAKTDLTTKLDKATTDLNGAQTALTNSETKFKAERKGRAEAIVDLAIAQGRRAVSERDTAVTALCNAADFDQAAKDLLAEAVKHKVGGTSLANMAGSKAAAGAEDPRATVQRMTEKSMADAGCSNDPNQYAKHRASVLSANPSLAESLKVRPAQ